MSCISSWWMLKTHNHHITEKARWYRAEQKRLGLWSPHTEFKAHIKNMIADFNKGKKASHARSR